MSAATQSEKLYKFGATEPEEHAWSTPRIFAREETRLCIASSRRPTELLKLLLKNMPESMWLLYVLIVPRGEGDAGRYQSREPLTRHEVEAFLDRFKDYLDCDGRHNLWLKAEFGPELLVSDRHDRVYAYGERDEWSKALIQSGWDEVDSKALALPDPHSHHYHAIFDDDAKQVLSSLAWDYSPLRDQDQ